VKGWIEARLYPTVEFDGSVVDIRSSSVEAEIIQALADVIPAGGHLMLDYENAGHENTFAELALQVPPVASYLGSLMFRAGCRGEFKDWYFSEGGHEGPRKLQANKSPDAKSERRAMANHRKQLENFLKRPIPRDADKAAIMVAAQNRARELLKDIRHART
jgi:hypothetical protein